MAADDRAGELTWGAKVDLVSSGEIRRRYIEAVRRADEGDFAPLITFARS
jgi:hypothetical protein